MTRRNKLPALLRNMPVLRPLRPLRRPRRRRRRLRLLPQPVSHLRGPFGEATVNCPIEKGRQAQRRNGNRNDRTTTATPELPNRAARGTQVRKSHGQNPRQAKRASVYLCPTPRPNMCMRVPRSLLGKPARRKRVRSQTLLYPSTETHARTKRVSFPRHML